MVGFAKMASDFDISAYQHKQSTLIVGPHRCGKTTLACALAQQLMTKVDLVIIISPDLEVRMQYQNLPWPKAMDLIVCSDYYGDLCQDVSLSGRYCDNTVLIIMENPKFKDITPIVVNGRHMHVTTIMTCDSICSVPPPVLLNLNYVFAFGTAEQKEREKLCTKIFKCLKEDDLNSLERYHCFVANLSDNVVSRYTMPLKTTKPGNKRVLSVNAFGGFKKPSPSVLVLGRGGSGKTTLIRDLMNRMHDNDASAKKWYLSCRHFQGDEKALKRCAATLKKLRYFQDNLVRNKKSLDDPIPHIVIVLEDITQDVLDLPATRWLFTNGHCLNISFFCSSAHPLDMSKIRGHVQYVFAFYDQRQSFKQQLYQDYFDQLEDFQTFCKVFENCASHQFECLVMDSSACPCTINWYTALRQ